MTADSGHEPTEWASVTRPTTQSTPAAQPVHYNSARHGSHVEESPELLRWRADLLMDEMMMGGVDVSAADGNRTFSGVDSPILARSQPPANGPINGNPLNSNNGRSPRDDSAAGYGRASTNGNERSGNERSSYDRPAYENQDYTRRENGARSTGPNGEASDSSYRNGNVNGAGQNGSAQNGIAPNNGQSATYNGQTIYPNRGEQTQPNNTNNSSQNYSNQNYPSQNTNTQANGQSNVNNGYSRPYESNRPAEGNGGAYPSPSASNHLAPEPPRTADTLPSDPYRGNAQPSSRPVDEEGYSTNRPSNEPPLSGPRSYEEPRQAPSRPMPPATPASSPDSSPAAPLTSTAASSLSSAGYENNRYENGNATADNGRPGRPDFSVPPATSSELPSMLRTTFDHAPAPSSDSRLRPERFYEDEQPSEPPRREQPMPPAEPRTASRPPLPPVEPPRPSVPPRVVPQPPDEHTKWATGADKWEYQDFGANPQAEEEPPLNSYTVQDRRDMQDRRAAQERRSGQESAVRSDPAQFVSAMSVMGSNKKRSTLLPRSTELDIDTLNREISDLHGEIAALLPVGNETSERARHLLDKAYSILQSDPSRSAEVEYYMQQVRTIVQRLRQSRQWSDLYRQRLQIYLWGWLGLSAMVLFARFVFQMDLEDAWMWLLGIDYDSWLVIHWATFVGTAFAGALGGAIGALYTMQSHARSEYSFFDRKYGLRGLILPFMGLLVGALGYVVFGLLFALIGIDPSQNLTIAIIPTVVAFAFGFSQESIYGTRG